MIMMIITMATLCPSSGDGLHGAAPGCDRPGRDGGTTRLRAAGGQAQPLGQWRLVDGWLGGWMDGWMDGWLDGWLGCWIDGWVYDWME